MPRVSQRKSPKKYDATLKDILDQCPKDWLEPFGLSYGDPIEVKDSDLSTVTTMADKVLRVSQPIPGMLHFEVQASYLKNLARRTLKDSVLIHDRYELPVFSIIVLLRRKAEDASLTGIYTYPDPEGETVLYFRYRVIRLWELPPEVLLGGGLGALPLVALSSVTRKALPKALRQVDARITREATPELARKLRAATFILMGLRYPHEVTEELLPGVFDMLDLRESSTYRALRAEALEEGIEKGHTGGLREIILILGTDRFGVPDAKVKRKLSRITDVEYLNTLTRLILKVNSWDEWLAAA